MYAFVKICNVHLSNNILKIVFKQKRFTLERKVKLNTCELAKIFLLILMSRIRHLSALFGLDWTPLFPILDCDQSNIKSNIKVHVKVISEY